MSRLKLYESKQWLYKKWVEDKMTVPEIAEAAGCSSRTVYSKLKEFGLIRK